MESKRLSWLFSVILLILPITNFAQDRKLTVLFCVKSFPSYTSWFILNQIAEFVKEGHEVTILARDPKITTVNDSHPDVVKYNLLEKTYVNYLPEHLRTFDIILCQFSSLAPYIIDFKEKYALEGKLAVFVRGAFCHRHEHHKEIRKRIFEESDLLLPICKFSKEQLIKLGCDPKKIEIIHSTIDCDKFVYRPRELPKNIIKIVTTSRLSEQKGLQYAIKAVKEVLKKYPNCEYRIIGNGELLDELTQLIHELHLENKVFLVGWKTPEQIKELLAEGHIFLHPSVTRKNGGHEAIPTAIMEAVASGVPAICTYHAGIPELIKEGKTGFLVPEKDHLALAEKIKYLIEHPDIWNKIGLAGRAAVKKSHDRKTENNRFMNFCTQYVFSS